MIWPQTELGVDSLLLVSRREQWPVLVARPKGCVLPQRQLDGLETGRIFALADEIAVFRVGVDQYGVGVFIHALHTG